MELTGGAITIQGAVSARSTGYVDTAPLTLQVLVQPPLASPLQQQVAIWYAVSSPTTIATTALPESLAVIIGY